VRSAANDRIAVIGVYSSAVPPVTALFLESENNGAKRGPLLSPIRLPSLSAFSAPRRCKRIHFRKK